jgi:hypothetical protein
MHPRRRKSCNIALTTAPHLPKRDTFHLSGAGQQSLQCKSALHSPVKRAFYCVTQVRTIQPAIAHPPSSRELTLVTGSTPAVQHYQTQRPHLGSAPGFCYRHACRGRKTAMKEVVAAWRHEIEGHALLGPGPETLRSHVCRALCKLTRAVQADARRRVVRRTLIIVVIRADAADLHRKRAEGTKHKVSGKRSGICWKPRSAKGVDAAFFQVAIASCTYLACTSTYGPQGRRQTA